MSTNLPPGSPARPVTTRRCPRPGCTEQVSLTRFACRADWFALPANLRIDINAAWRVRQNYARSPNHLASGVAIREHLDACAAAMRWFRANTPTATP